MSKEEKKPIRYFNLHFKSFFFFFTYVAKKYVSFILIPIK